MTHQVKNELLNFAVKITFSLRLSLFESRVAKSNSKKKRVRVLISIHNMVTKTEDKKNKVVEKMFKLKVL